MTKRMGLVFGCLMALGGCVGGEASGTPAELTSVGVGATSSPVVTLPAEPAFDVATAVERARSAFFVSDGAYVAGSETHRVELVDESDAVAVTPMHDTVAATEQERMMPLHATRPSPVVPASTRLVAEQPFVARTASIARGSVALEAQPRGIAPSHGSIEIARGTVTETLTDTRDGLEQSWRFASRPLGASEDELVVRVAVSGMDHVGTTQGGEHFRDAATGLGVRYGHGTWVDARGVRTSVPVRYEGGALVLAVPGEIVDGSAYPAVLDPVIGPEVAMDTPVTGPRGGNQVQPAIASNGTNAYLLVFTDGLFGDDDIRCVHVSSTGVLLDATSIVVAAETGSQQQAARVAWNGSNYVVVWQDSRNGDWDVYGTIVATGGGPMIEGGVPLAMTAGVDELEPALASAGSTSLLTWTSGTDTTSDVLGARLDGTGARVDAVAFTVGGGAGVQDTSAVAASATSFLVVYTDDPDAAGAGTPFVRGRRVAASGTALIDAAFFNIAATSFAPTASWAGGTNYLAAWTGASAGRFAIFASTIPVSGTVTPAAAIVSPSVAGRDYLNPSLAWNGSQYLMAYFDGVYDGTMMAFTTVDIGARFLTAGGATSGAAIDPTSIASNVSQARVASLGSGFFIVYTDASGESSDIRGTRVTGTTVNDPTGILLSSGPNDQTQPIVAGDGTGWLVTWTDFRSGNIDAWSATLGATGAVVGAPALLAGGATSQVPTGAAWSGSRYLVVFVENGNVRGVTVTAAGIPGAPFDIATSTTLTAESAAVACSASIQCLVAWQQYDGAAMPIDSDIRASRVDASSASPTVSPSVVVVSGAGNQFSPSVGASSARFYVAWTDDRTAGNTDVRGTRFLATPLEAGGTIVGGAAGAQYGSAIASDGTDFLVVFIDQRAGGTHPNDVYGQRVAGGTGALTGANFVIAGGTDDEVDPSVAYSGRYLVAWSHATTTTSSIEGMRINATGTLVDTIPLAISSSAPVNDAPRLAAGTGGHWLVTYRTFTGGAARTAARTIGDDLATGAMCSGASECASGFCVDGVCCMTACAGGTTDCNACSIAAGAASDGTCGPITSCGDAGTGVDSGVDAGATGTDAGVDAGATGTDAGADAGATGTDAGADSGGTGTDSGTTGTDSGMTGTDTGVRNDGGMTMGDASMTMRDAGTTPPPASGGCACSVPASPGASHRGLAGLVGIGLALVWRRRRRAA